MNFTFGADPELFVFNKETNQPVSAYGFLEGTKKNPMIVENGALQVDGMALEFNINPSNTTRGFYSNIHSVVNQLKMFVPEGHELRAVPVAEFGSEYIKAQPEAAVELGCDPDFNAYKDGDINPTPNVETPFRTGSGHIHIGWTENANLSDSGHIEACCWVAKQMDFFVGLPSLLFGDRELMLKRRKLYGKAGCFRPKSYGCEYRTLDNYWMQSKKHVEYVFRQTQYAMSCLEQGYHMFNEYMSGFPESELERIINECDVEAAKKAMSEAYTMQVYNIPEIYNSRLLK